MLWAPRDPLRAFSVAQARGDVCRGGNADGERENSRGEVDEDEDGGEPEGEFGGVVA